MHTVFIIADKIVNYMKSHTGVFCLVYARVIDHLLVSPKVRESKAVLMDFGFYVLDCGFLVRVELAFHIPLLTCTVKTCD